MNMKKRKFFRKRLAVTAIILMTACMLDGCFIRQVDTAKNVLISELKERLETVLAGKERLTALVTGSGEQEENAPGAETTVEESGTNPEIRHNEAAVLEGYDEIAEAMDSVMAEYIDEDAEDESVTMEEAAQMTEEFYQTALEWEEEGRIISCTWNEVSNSVGMTLPTGARILFAPHVADTYSGDYSLDTVNESSWLDTVMLSTLDEGSVEGHGKYIYDTMDDCTGWRHLERNEVTVDRVVELLENAEENHCRLILWLGHGQYDDGKSVLELTEKVNDDTTERYEEDVDRGWLIEGGTNYWITPEFINHHMAEVSGGGFFVCGACYSTTDGGVLARAFLNKGFRAYTGTSGAVNRFYSDKMMKTIAETLCEADSSSPGETMTARDALKKAKDENGDIDDLLWKQTEFRLFEKVTEENEGIRTDNLSEDDTAYVESGRTITPFRLTEHSIIHNGSSVVRYNGNDYYWKYNGNSKMANGLFAYFSDNTETENQMICRHADGTEEVLFSGKGNGDFYIIGERMYLGFGGSREISGLYSVRLDGSDRVDYPDFYLQTADARSGLLIGTNGNNLQVISTQDGNSRVIGNQYYKYCGTIGRYAYFSATYGDTMQIALYRFHMYKSGSLDEIDRFTLDEDYRYESYNVAVMEVSMLDNVLYYSYGYYSGTAGMFQQGGINCVELGGNGKPVSRKNCVKEIHAEEFLVEKEGGNIQIYYEDSDDYYGSYIGYWDDYVYLECSMKNFTTGRVSDPAFALSRAGSYVYLDGRIVMIEEHQAAYTTVIPNALVSSYGCKRNYDNEDTVTLIRDLERVEDDVYYTVEKSARNPEADMGWRPAYQRQESVRYKITIGADQAERLYSY